MCGWTWHIAKKFIIQVMVTNQQMWENLETGFFDIIYSKRILQSYGYKLMDVREHLETGCLTEISFFFSQIFVNVFIILWKPWEIYFNFWLLGK